MEKQPYFIGGGDVRLGGLFGKEIFKCFYVISPYKIYIFYTSKNLMYKQALAGLGGAVGGLLYGLSSQQKQLEAHYANEFDSLKDLPEDLRNHLPSFLQFTIISKEEVSEVKKSLSNLRIKLRKGQIFDITIPFLRFSKVKRLKPYLKLYRWI